MSTQQRIIKQSILIPFYLSLVLSICISLQRQSYASETWTFENMSVLPPSDIYLGLYNVHTGSFSRADKIILMHYSDTGSIVRGYETQILPDGTNSGWTSHTYWTSAGLDPETTYTFRVKARNGNLVDTEWTYLGSETTPPCLVPCLGDFDWDGDVDGSDLAVFAADFGRTDCLKGDKCEGDFDKDYDIDEKDLAIFTSHFGRNDCP